MPKKKLKFPKPLEHKHQAHKPPERNWRQHNESISCYTAAWLCFFFYQDGAERWRKWDELLQLVWMLMLSHQEVITGTEWKQVLFLYTHSKPSLEDEATNYPNRTFSPSPSGHLHFSIAERFKRTRAPMWTQNDQVTRAEVQEAAEGFRSRAMEDLGHDLPSQTQESLSQLQEHLLSISLQ